MIKKSSYQSRNGKSAGEVDWDCGVRHAHFLHSDTTPHLFYSLDLAGDPAKLDAGHAASSEKELAEISSAGV